MQRYKIDNGNINYSAPNINFELNVGEDYALNLQQLERLNNNYVEKVEEENVNKILDYEKHIFYPAYLTSDLAFSDEGEWINNGLIELYDPTNNSEQTTYDIDSHSDDVNSITFNIFLREREKNENGEYDEWETNDTLYWNKWDGSYDENDKKIIKHDGILNGGDLLSDLGFTDNDVFYQKNALKKSFLRISVYDSPYKQSQKLLYYSTLFFDTNVLYKKYTNLIGKTCKDQEDLPYVARECYGNDCLTASFKCTSKYDNNGCSDGFYLYLFNTIVKNGSNTPLYLKIEFNNAKFGKTVPLICPRYKEISGANSFNDPILFNSNVFPEDYMSSIIDTEGNPVSYIDMPRLYNDLYIPIFVRYNNKKNRFEWYVASNDSKEQAKDVVFNLYEPRINRLTQSEGGRR